MPCHAWAKQPFSRRETKDALTTTGTRKGAFTKDVAFWYKAPPLPSLPPLEQCNHHSHRRASYTQPGFAFATDFRTKMRSEPGKYDWLFFVYRRSAGLCGPIYGKKSFTSVYLRSRKIKMSSASLTRAQRCCCLRWRAKPKLNIVPHFCNEYFQISFFPIKSNSRILMLETNLINLGDLLPPLKVIARPTGHMLYLYYAYYIILRY